MIIFFSLKKPIRISKKIQLSNVEKLIKSKRKLAKCTNQNVNHKTLKNLFQLIYNATQSYTKIKSGNVIALITTGLNLLSETNKNDMLSTVNQTSKESTVKRYKTVATIGKGFSRKIMRFRNGPVHEEVLRTLHSSLTDSLKSSRRQQLSSHHGINQRSFCFMSNVCCLTIGDIKNLVNYDQYSPSLVENYVDLARNITKQALKNKVYNNKIIKEQIKKDLSENEDDLIIKKDLKKTSINKKIIRYNAALLKTKFCLEVTNTLPEFDSKIKIHLVKFKSRCLDKNQATVDHLIKNLQYDPRELKHLLSKKNKKENRYITERIMPQDVVSVSKNTVLHQIITTGNTDILRLESFRINCEVVNTWCRTLSPKSIWNFELNQEYFNGIQMNVIQSLELLDCRTPITPFLIIESSGKNNCIVTRKKDKAIFYGQHSPGNHHYEMKFQIKYLANPDDEDKLLIMKSSRRNTEFEDEELGLEYYPDREPVPFNVNYENLDMPYEAASANREFELSSDASEIPNSNALDKLINKISNIYGKEMADDLTEDDLAFENRDTETLLEDDDDDIFDLDLDV